MNIHKFKRDEIRNENGQALIITVLCMTCLLGFTALATDVGVMLRAKRLTQTAADAAAIAGALEINYAAACKAGATPALISSSAAGAATQNGFTDSSNGATVTINCPPTVGPHAGLANYVEAVVKQKQPAIFMGLFGFSSMDVVTRAVAFNGGASYACVVVLSPNASEAMKLQGSFDVNTPNCGVVVDSTASNALCVVGGAGTMVAGSVGVVGGDTGGECNHANADTTPDPVTGIIPYSDPLGAISFPTPSALPNCTVTSTSSLTTVTVPSGNSCTSGAASLTNVTFGKGTFVFTGNLTVGGTVNTATVAQGGTTIDMNSGAFTVNTGTTLSMFAPQCNPCAAGMYNGMALMQPASNPSTITIQFGSSTGTLQGIIYAPGANLLLHDSGGDSKGGISLITDLIVNTLDDQTATLDITSYSQNTGNSPLTKVTLVE